jgi:hypothetical protein
MNADGKAYINGNQSLSKLIFFPKDMGLCQFDSNATCTFIVTLGHTF